MHSAVATSKETEVNVRILKRDNQTLQDWIPQKLERAIRAAATDAKRELGKEDMTKLIRAITKESISQSKDTDNIISVDDIQKIVKKELMELKYHEVAEAYILYSNKRDEARKKRLETNPDSISDYIQCTKYARYIPVLQRRETYKETNDRSRNMHIKKYPQIANEINEAFDLVDNKYVLPSMRARQFGGKAIETNHTRIYNCSFSVCNRPRFFAEGFYLLLCGTGTGFSVQWKHVDQLPELSRITKNKVKHHVIEDTIEGWADALDALVHSYFNGGEYVEFAYCKIRPFGSELKISGGKAPGHLPLKEAIDNIRGILDKAQGRQLKPIECYDMMCMAADAVYAGGIREAAMICLFSIDDGEMMNSKTGNWFPVYPWRQRSNNSVVLKRNEIRKAQFDRIFKATKEWGEPGFYFTDDEDTGSNPCCEIGLNPKLEITPEVKIFIDEYFKKKGDKKKHSIKIGDVYWGWQFCNLSEVNAAKCKTKEQLFEAVRAASIIGTVQAGYTDLDYLGWISEVICMRESLLGVSMTGIMDNPDIALDPEIQKEAAQYAVVTNIQISRLIGINSAARVTTVKPSGTASLVLGCVGSGIHPHHARRYFRRIRATPGDPIYEMFKANNPHMCTAINDRKEMITFTIKAPDGALVRHDLTAIQFLKHVLSTQKNWVMSGTARPNSSPKLTHNVSNTITVKQHEWKEVAEFLWENKQYFSGVSLLSDFGDKIYANAPREEVKTEADEAKWQQIISQYKEVKWVDVKEEFDNTNLQGEAACAGGSCDLKL